MMESQTTPTQPDPLETRAQQAAASWRRLGLRLRSISPADFMRFLLVGGALAAIGWVIWFTWVPLIPFIVGGVVAYILLPLVNWLNRFMPRLLAVLLALGLTLAIGALFLALLVPTLVEEFYRIYLLLPNAEQIRGQREQLNQYIATLPPSAQRVINNAFNQATTNVQSNMDIYLANLGNLAVAAAFGLINTISFVLGFVVVPIWLLSVLHDHPQGTQAFNRMLPAWLRPDLLAVLRILNRALNAFMRGQVVLALTTVGLTYLGLELLVRFFGLPGSVRYQLLLAMIAGLMQLIPNIGPFLGVIPAIVVGLHISVEFTLAVVGLYIGVQMIILNWITPKVEQSIINIHPALLLVVIVALSQFGFWWVLLASPLVAILLDLFRYTYGRLSNPPRPAGLLPNEPWPQPSLNIAQTKARFYRRPNLAQSQTLKSKK